MKTKVRGFSLIELMIVVAILGVISAIAIPMYTGYLKTSRDNVAKQNIATLRVFEDNYHIDNGEYFPGTYIPGGTGNTLTDLGWTPDGDDGEFQYTVAACTLGIKKCYVVTVVGFDGKVNMSETYP